MATVASSELLPHLPNSKSVRDRFGTKVALIRISLLLSYSGHLSR